tara:strand:- start:3125 stop:4144 length:1020 start_codon:yes stop_codon:yes gene_type:complete
MVHEQKIISTAEVRDFLLQRQGEKTSLKEIRLELNISQGSRSFDAVRNILFQLAEQREVVPLGQGFFRVVKQVSPVQVFGKKPASEKQLLFPRCYDTGLEMSFGEDIIMREGDLILLSGRSNFGKTALCLNFCGANIALHPILMGNEYTTLGEEPAPKPRFLHALANMEWVNWKNGNGDAFSLLPVYGDYAEHIHRGKLNIIDWINQDAGALWEISRTMEGIKRELGRGIAIVAIQKGDDANAGRGGQFTKDFADCELLLDRYGTSDEVKLTIGKVKESRRPVLGRTFAYKISRGVRITDFREVIRCQSCYGKGWIHNKPCESCQKIGWVDKPNSESIP